MKGRIFAYQHPFSTRLNGAVKISKYCSDRKNLPVVSHEATITNEIQRGHWSKPFVVPGSLRTDAPAEVPCERVNILNRVGFAQSGRQSICLPLRQKQTVLFVNRRLMFSFVYSLKIPVNLLLIIIA